MDFASMLAGIPYLATQNVRVEEPVGDEVVVHMPFAKPVTNYIGTVHAGALFSLAETAAGIAAFKVGSGRAIVLLRGANIRYAKIAKQDVVAKATVNAEVASKAVEDFGADGRADAAVQVKVEGADGTPLFAGTFDYALRPAR